MAPNARNDPTTPELQVETAARKLYGREPARKRESSLRLKHSATPRSTHTHTHRLVNKLFRLLIVIDP